jgi:hypothetical protein
MKRTHSLTRQPDSGRSRQMSWQHGQPIERSYNSCLIPPHAGCILRSSRGTAAGSDTFLSLQADHTECCLLYLSWPVSVFCCPTYHHIHIIAGTPDSLGGNTSAMLYAFIYLNLTTGSIILPIIVATLLFSKRTTRHPILINVFMTWIFSGVFSCLL